MKTAALLLALSGLLATAAETRAQVADGAAIEIAVTGVRNDRGSVRVGVCTQAQFLKTDCVAHASAPAQKGVTRITVPAVPPGTYAIQVFHDANNNRRVDQLPFGIPLEDIAFSRDAPIRMAPPQWDEAKITHAAEPQVFTVRMRRLR